MKTAVFMNSLGWGGAERVGIELSEGLSKLGNDMTIFTNKGSIQDYSVSDNIRVVYFNKSNHNKLLSHWLVFKQLLKYLNSEKPDVIILITAIYCEALLLARAFSRHKCSIILTDHDSFQRPDYKPMSKRTYYNKWILSRFVDYLTVLTNADKKFIGNRLNNVRVMYNPTAMPMFERNKSNGNSKIVMAAGRLDAWHYKGLDILIKAWNIVSAKHPDWKLKIFGRGTKENMEYLKSIVRDSKSIEFCGHTNSLDKEYQKAEIYVLSSRYEGWGLVMVEAMRNGCATIAANYHGRQAECIEDGVSGLLVEPENVEQLEHAISRLIENLELRRELQHNAPKESEKFAIDKVALRWNNFLKEVITAKTTN